MRLYQASGSQKLQPCKASEHIPEWSKSNWKEENQPSGKSEKKKPVRKKKAPVPQSPSGFVTTTKDDIMSDI